MTNEIHPDSSAGNDGYEHRDIGINAILYFLAGLAVFVVISYFLAGALYHYLDKRTASEQAPVSPMVANAPADTRHLSVDYKDYLKQNFPSPQLEIDERNQLDKIRLDEEQTLSTYDYIDQKAGTVRIPIDRAMDLIAERGLPVRAQAGEAAAAPKIAAQMNEKDKKKGPKQ